MTIAKKHFNIRQFVFFFILGGLFGTIYQVLFGFFQNGIWSLHKELIFFPLVPTYGFIVAFLALFGRKKRKWWQSFLFSFFLFGSVEYLFNLFYDWCFGVQFWNYSSLFGNINGRTTIFSCVFGGIIGTLFLFYLLPFFLKFLKKSWSIGQKVFLYVFFLLILGDILFTYIALGRMHLRNEGYPPYTFLGKFYDSFYSNEVLFQNLSLQRVSSSKTSDCSTENEKQFIWPGSSLIGHAFFGIDQHFYTSSLEAFYEGYQKGIRTFEVDFQFTRDDELVLVHDWSLFSDFDGNALSFNEFQNYAIYGLYHTVSFRDLLHLMEKYPDIWIVTDGKYTDLDLVRKQFEYMRDVSKEQNLEHLLDRFVVQIYKEDMYDVITSVYSFSNFIFTVYQVYEKNVTQGISFSEEDYQRLQEICLWSQKHGIQNITFPKEFYNQKVQSILSQNDLNLYLHTENNIDTAKKYFQDGVKGLYTDVLTFHDFE